MNKSILRKPSDIKDVFGAFLLEGAHFSSGKYDMPVVRSNIDNLPKKLVSYQRVGVNGFTVISGTALHFYVYDNVFDGKYGVWNSLIRGIEFKRGFNLKKLQGFDCIIVPDYSLYLDMPVAMQIWNIYRSRVVAYALQQLGYKVIINVRWTNESSYEFCFEGIERGSVVAVGSYGCSKNKKDKFLFKNGLLELIHRIAPKVIIIYGAVTPEVKQILIAHNQEYIQFLPEISSLTKEKHHGDEV